MLTFLGERLLSALLTLAIAAVAVFLVVHMIPGDPVMIMLGEASGGDPETVARVRESLGLDRPLVIQFWHWASRLVQGNFGLSLRSGEPVLGDLLIRIPRSLELIAGGLVVAIGLGLPLGVISARNRGKLSGAVSSVVSVIGFSAPVFVTGVLLVILFAVWLRLLPPSGYVALADDPWLHFSCLILPSLAIGINFMGVVARVTRASLIDTLDKDYVALARAKGLSKERALLHHALPNAMVPVIAIIGIRAGNLLGGTVIVEALFDWPGLSSLLVSAAFARDYPVVQGSLIAIFTLFIFISLFIDLTQSFFDPRVRAKA